MTGTSKITGDKTVIENMQLGTEMQGSAMESMDGKYCTGQLRK